MHGAVVCKGHEAAIESGVQVNRQQKAVERVEPLASDTQSAQGFIWLVRSSSGWS
jgi:hypothetical protein